MWTQIKAFLSAISAVKEIFSMAVKLFEQWQEKKRLEKKEAVKESVDNAIKNKDQREFEREIGSDNAGLPTKHKLDSVQKRAAKDRS